MESDTIKNQGSLSIASHDEDKCCSGDEQSKISNTQPHKLGPWLRASQNGRRIIVDWGKKKGNSHEPGTEVCNPKKSNKVISNFLMEKLRSLTVREEAIHPKEIAENQIESNQMLLDDLQLVGPQDKGLELKVVKEDNSEVRMIMQQPIVETTPSFDSDPMQPKENILGSEVQGEESMTKEGRKWKRICRQTAEPSHSEQVTNPLKRTRDPLNDISNFPNSGDSVDRAGKKLDRALGNQRWCDLFPDYKMLHLPPGDSDHIPILMDVEPRVFPRGQSRDSLIFRFEQMWTTHDECAEVIKDSWRDEGTDALTNAFPGKLSVMAERLRLWNRDTFGHVGKKIKHLQSDLSLLRSQMGATANMTEIRRQVLMDHVARRIGNGEGTVVMKDNWIPGFNANQIRDECHSISDQLRVCFLLNEFAQWNREQISNLFPAHISKCILGIPLSRTPVHDSWYWTQTPNGNYSVKTGYKVLRKIGQDPTASPDYFSNFSEVWNRIWKAQMPSKIKLFLWRASREVLPVRPRCPLGCSEEESVLHALVGCPDLRLFWRKTAIPLTDQFDCKLPFIEWLNCALPTWDAKNLVLFSACAYNLWYRRNEVRIEGKSACLEQIWVNSHSFVKDIFQIHTSEGCSVAHHASTLRWERPTPPFYKINVDASVKQGPDGGIGCVARDGSGRVLAALAKRVPSAGDVDILEATAIFTGMEFARDLSIQDIVVEGDSTVVLGYLSSAVSLRSPLGLILDNIRSLCASFRRVEFKWVRREANGVADLLASLGLNVESTYVWLEDRPCVLACALQLDGC
ncbi:uncharacterized protein G2W53_039060 [Senna tora]|uniref:RNase H type-1 domain-containing protein n=1 Tax=Senna tora TaxID=362788 RepID=A0A834W7L4_9FABA|nr:uncharacterized protein G2W53_039060 [Senna tora]